MAFIDVVFPEDISWGSAGGPEFRTTIVELWSGHEQRNRDWLYPRNRYNVRYGIKDWADLQVVYDFFWAMGGRANSFWFRDRFDWWSGVATVDDTSNVQYTDQSLGIPSASTQQLVKNYTQGSSTLIRDITKPVSGTVRVGWSGVERTQGVDWNVNTATGIISFLSSPAPAANVTAGYEFMVPVRFAEDYFSATWINPGLMDSDIFLVEVRDLV